VENEKLDINKGIAFMNSPIKYPVFEVEENAFLRQKILSTAIPQTDSKYFQINRRFNISDEERIVSKELVDCMGIYEEGDWWCLTVVKIKFSDNQVKYIFLPLSSGIVNTEAPTIKGLFDNQSSLIGLITKSAFYGERHWVLFDAIADLKFLQQLMYLFFPTDPYTVLLDTEFGGKFNFYLPTQISMKEISTSNMSMEFKEGHDISIKYNETHQIILYKDMKPISDVLSLQEKENLIGYITYSNPLLSELLIGVLVRVP